MYHPGWLQYNRNDIYTSLDSGSDIPVMIASDSRVLLMRER